MADMWGNTQAATQGDPASLSAWLQSQTTLGNQRNAANYAANDALPFKPIMGGTGGNTVSWANQGGTASNQDLGGDWTKGSGKGFQSVDYAAPETPTGGGTGGAGSRPREQFSHTIDTLGDKGGQTWDQSKGWQGGGTVAAGTALGDTGAKTTANYDASRDTFAHDYNGKPAESSWRRVNRWMEAGVYEHGMTAQDAYNAALSRLKRDLGDNWQASGFDLSNVQAAAPGQDWGAPGTPQLVNPQTGGAGGTPDPNNWTDTTTGGKVADSTAPGNGNAIPQQPVPTAGPAPVANSQASTTGPGSPGFQGLFWQQHPQQAVDAFLRSHSIDPDQHTFMGDWMSKMMNALAPSLMSNFYGSNGKPALDQLADPNQLLNSIMYGGSGTMGGNLQNFAQTAMKNVRGNAGVFSQLGDTALQQMLSQLQGLNTFGNNPYLAQAQGNAFDAQMNAGQRQQTAQTLAGTKPTSLWDFINQQAQQTNPTSYGLPWQ